MKVSYQLVEKDYSTFLKQLYFHSNLVKQVALTVAIAGLLASVRAKGQPIIIIPFIVKFIGIGVLVYLLFVVIPYLLASARVNKTLLGKNISKSVTIENINEGVTIRMGHEYTIIKWPEIRTVGKVKDYLYTKLYDGRYYVVPLAYFSSSSESDKFANEINAGIINSPDNNKIKKLHNLYYWGLLGLIPNFGAIAGIILLIKGANVKDKKLMVIGISCVMLTVLFWVLVAILV